MRLGRAGVRGYVFGGSDDGMMLTGGIAYIGVHSQTIEDIFLMDSISHPVYVAVFDRANESGIP